MNRIFFEKPQNTLVDGNGGANVDKTKEYFEKVASLVPSEIIIAYLAIVGLVPLINDDNLEIWFFYGAVLVCTILTPLYMRIQTPANAPYKPITNYVISTIAFLIWAYATTGDKAPYLYYNSAIASIILILFSLISGAIPLR